MKSIVKSKVIGKKISPSPKQLSTDVQKKIISTKKNEHRATKMVGDSKSQADLSIFKGSWPKGNKKYLIIHMPKLNTLKVLSGDITFDQAI